MRGLVVGLRLWLPAVVFVLLNLAGLAAYYLVYSGRAQEKVARFDRLTTTRQDLVAERERLERARDRLEAASEAIDSFYKERLGTEAERFTGVIAEIKLLASTAGLEPAAITYASEPIEEQGVVRRSLSFSVAGSYLDLRRLVNLLELSSSFVTLDRIGLTEDSGGADLRIQLGLSALFADLAGIPSLAAERGSPTS
jgi:Tfp pilus assembly protein PilO